jgi:hypothetical protein
MSSVPPPPPPKEKEAVLNSLPFVVEMFLLGYIPGHMFGKKSYEQKVTNITLVFTSYYSLHIDKGKCLYSSCSSVVAIIFYV